MRSYLKNLIFLIVFIGFQAAHAGSYDDFFIAIKQDDAKTITDLLRRGFDPNTRDPKGMHGLYLALQEPSFKAAQALIDWPKTDIDARNKEGESALMIAALKGHTEMARKLVARGADINKTGWTPLHYAATSGNLELIRLFLEKSAYIDAESPNGTTPLMMAAHYGTPEAVKLLIEEGADPGLKNQLGLSAIDFAWRANRKEVADTIAGTIRLKQPRGKW